MTKRYDRGYFDRWYRREGFGSPSHVARKVQYALAAAEYLMERPLRSVLDVGCGEGSWQPVLRRLRPRASYTGVDPSAYAVRRHGARRNLRVGGLDDLDAMDLGGPFDLVVCVDVLPYAPAAAVRRGLASIARIVRGVALIELFTSADSFEGDLAGFRRRSAATYERWFADAGLEHIGPNLFAGASLLEELSVFERGSSPTFPA